MRKEIEVNLIEMPPNETTTKVNVKIDISELLGELKLFDALFHIELTVGREKDLYHYSFVKRDIRESPIIFPMFIRGQITDLSTVNHSVHISYIKKENK